MGVAALDAESLSGQIRAPETNAGSRSKGGVVAIMETGTKAVIRGCVYIATIAVVFGFCQNSILAGFFMLFFLLFIEKLFRLMVFGTKE